MKRPPTSSYPPAPPGTPAEAAPPAPNAPLYEPGTVVELYGGDATPGEQAVYLGPVGRGLHLVAVADVWYPYYVDPIDGSRPKLRNATWTPRRVRRSTITKLVNPRGEK